MMEERRNVQNELIKNKQYVSRVVQNTQSDKLGCLAVNGTTTYIYIYIYWLIAMILSAILMHHISIAKLDQFDQSVLIGE